MIKNNHSLYNAFIRDLENLGNQSVQFQTAKSNQDKQMALSLISKHKKVFTELLDNMDWLSDEVSRWGYYYGCA